MRSSDTVEEQADVGSTSKPTDEGMNILLYLVCLEQFLISRLIILFHVL